MIKTKKISNLLWALLFAWGSVNAAGLGRLTVQSALGQPLKAEIELLSVTKDDLADITVKLASPEAFRLAHIDRQEALVNLRFAVDQRANGQPVIRISSTASVPDPFLDMLIELNWRSGRLVREYTVLLDPPPAAKPAETLRPLIAPPELAATLDAKPAVQPDVQVQSQTQSQAQAQSQSQTQAQAQAQAQAKPRKKPAPVPAEDVAEAYGPVRSGETLRAIANKVRTPDVSVDQMLVGLYRANKKAFHNDNMNSLNRGAVLKIPDGDAIGDLSQVEAEKTVAAHASEWYAYRRKLSQVAAAAARPVVEDQSAGKIVPQREVVAPPVAATTKDVLKLSKGEPGKVDKNGKDAKDKAQEKVLEKVNAMEEELAAKARALQEAQDRVSQLERTVLDMQKLLEMKAQEKAQEKAQQATQAAPSAEPVAVAPVEPAQTPAPEPAPAVVPPVVPLPAVAPPAPAEAPAAGWMSSLLGNPLYIGGFVAALLLSALVWMMVVSNRRRKSMMKFEDSIMTGGEFKNNNVFNATGDAAAGANTESSMLLTDFSRLGMGAIDNHEVDPIAEAEVYMAYGRDAQAEEILREALAKDPARHEIALKLLELYVSRKDANAFEATASDLYASLGGQNTPVWQRAAEMGRSIDPDNPLYQAASASTGGAVKAAPAMARAPVAAAAVASAAAASVMASDVEPAGEALGDLEELASMAGWDEEEKEEDKEAEKDTTPTLTQEVAPGSDADNGLDFTATSVADFAPQPEAAPSVASVDDNLMEFELPEPALEVNASPPELADLDLNEVEDFSLDADLSAAFDLPQAEAAAKSALPELPDESALDFVPALAAAPEAASQSAVPVDEMAEFELPETMGEVALDESALDASAGEETESASGESSAMPVFDLSDIDLDLDLDEMAEAQAKAEAEAVAKPEPEAEEKEVTAEVEDLFAAFEMEAASELDVAPVEELPVAEMPGAEMPGAEPPAQTEPELDPELREEVNTKLDLARAYLEMGDREGAREILQEVLGEGDTQQKAEAAQLMADAS